MRQKKLFRQFLFVTSVTLLIGIGRSVLGYAKESTRPIIPLPGYSLPQSGKTKLKDLGELKFNDVYPTLDELSPSEILILTGSPDGNQFLPWYWHIIDLAVQYEDTYGCLPVCMDADTAATIVPNYHCDCEIENVITHTSLCLKAREFQPGDMYLTRLSEKQQAYLRSYGFARINSRGSIEKEDDLAHALYYRVYGEHKVLMEGILLL